MFLILSLLRGDWCSLFPAAISWVLSEYYVRGTKPHPLLTHNCVICFYCKHSFFLASLSFGMGTKQRNLFNEELQKAAMSPSTILQLTDATAALDGFAVMGTVAINIWKSFDRFSQHVLQQLPLVPSRQHRGCFPLAIPSPTLTFDPTPI